MNLEPDPHLIAAIQGLPHDKRWDVLKPKLASLFQLDLDYAAIAHHMKTQYGFDAQISAYKYRFNKKWGWKRSIPSSKKEQILEYAQSRAVVGKRTAVSFGTTSVDAKKLRRHVASFRRSDVPFCDFQDISHAQLSVLGTYFPFGARPFSMWSLPPVKLPPATLPVSPMIWSVDTPSDIEVDTPSATHHAHEAISPEAGPSNALSPFSAAVSMRASADNTNLFLQGHFGDLLQKMNSSQKRILSNWLHQFWMFAFKVCKDWGKNSTVSNYINSEFDPFQATSPQTSMLSPSYILSPREDVDTSIERHRYRIKPPSSLCNWSIHIREDVMYGQVDELIDDEEDREQVPMNIEKTLQDALEQNNFSTIQSDDIPIKVSQVAMAASVSPTILFEESLSFAIMARNFKALRNTLKARGFDEGRNALKAIKAAHMAVSYLDGGTACCLVLHEVCSQMGFLGIRESYINDYGHTVLDSLFLTILKCHSAAPIGVADESLERGVMFAGIEVDICGRWDADSPCFQSLATNGETTIPRNWKHKFCNTSVQAICHCIQVLSLHYPRIDHHSSGLFQHLCTHCGTKLQLRPLHALVMIGYVLANNSCTGEDLFGVVACYLCLVSRGASPLGLADVSVAALTKRDEPLGVCNHTWMTPYDILQNLPVPGGASCPTEVRVGWNLLLHVCERAENGRAELVDGIKEAIARVGEGCPDEDRLDDDHLEEEFEAETEYRAKIAEALSITYNRNCSHRCNVNNTEFEYDGVFGTDSALGHLWASVQAEFLNYRRLDEVDSWQSENFNALDIIRSLDEGTIPDTGFVRNGLLKDYCPCGGFGTFRPPVREEVSNGYYSNVDCWERTSFIETLDFDY